MGLQEKPHIGPKLAARRDEHEKRGKQYAKDHVGLIHGIYPLTGQANFGGKLWKLDAKHVADAKDHDDSEKSRHGWNLVSGRDFDVCENEPPRD